MTLDTSLSTAPPCKGAKEGTEKKKRKIRKNRTIIKQTSTTNFFTFFICSKTSHFRM